MIQVFSKLRDALAAEHPENKRLYKIGGGGGLIYIYASNANSARIQAGKAFAENATSSPVLFDDIKNELIKGDQLANSR